MIKSVNIVDLPGQENIRLKFFDQFKDSAKLIILFLSFRIFEMINHEFITLKGGNICVRQFNISKRSQGCCRVII